MTLRMRLLLWLLPTLLVFVGLLFAFYYFYLYKTVISLAGPDIPAAFIDTKLDNMMKILLFGAVVATAFIAASVYFIADKISAPMQKLKAGALDLAAGQYGKTIEIKGPREIVEVANTLNTVSECVQEQIIRLQENALVRERLFGEYECSLLMQQHMLQKVIDEYHNSQLSIQLIKILSSEASRGVFLRLHTDTNGDIRIILVEAKEQGFEGIYELLSQTSQVIEKAPDLAQTFPMIDATLCLESSSLAYTSHILSPPLVWSVQANRFAEPVGGSLPVDSGDLIFFFNQGFVHQFPDQETLQECLSKVLRHFATETLDVFTGMLSSELNFLTNRQTIEEDLHILCMKKA